jgi:Tol biopolymer transport system component
MYLNAQSILGTTSRTRRALALVGVLFLVADVAAAQGWRERRRARREKARADAAAATPAAAPSASLVSRVSTLKQGGSRLDWVDNKIAYDMMGPDRVFNIHVMRPDGSDSRCLTCNHPDLPKRNIGQPTWHPGGRYLVFQAEKGEHRKVRMGHVTSPGAGVLNDLWALDTQTNRASPIREVRDEPGQGTLHPHFSSDGRMLSWSEMKEKGGLSRKQQLGYWQLMVGDFRVESGRPRLTNVRSYEPGGIAFYENHGFSPDGSRLIFTSNFEGKGRGDYDIYTVDLRTRQRTRLTSEDYNEHAQYSPDGRHIVWMSNRGNKSGGTDYWIMNADGSNKRRLTHFNEKGYPEYVGRKISVADFAWRPDGTAIAGYTGGKVLFESSTDPPNIMLVELRPLR